MCTDSLSEKYSSGRILVVEKLRKILSTMRGTVAHKDSIDYTTDRFIHMSIIFWPGLGAIVVWSGMTGIIKNVLNLKLVVSSFVL